MTNRDSTLALLVDPIPSCSPDVQRLVNYLRELNGERWSDPDWEPPAAIFGTDND